MPPDVKRRWDDNDWWTQELLLAYNAGRDKEEIEMKTG